MRTLANIALSFAAGILLCCYLPEGMWRLWAAGALALAGLGLAAWKKCLAARPKLRRRVLLALFSLCAALVYFAGWRQLIVRPVTERFGTESTFSGTVLDYAQESSYGARVELSLDGYPGAKAYYYGLGGAALARAGAEALRHRALAGRRAHPRERDHDVHVEGRVRAAVRSGRAGDHGRGEGEPALSAAARVPRLSGENPRYLGRIGRHGLSSGGADGRAQRHQRDGQPDRLRGRAEPPVRRLGAALRVSREPAGDADSGAPAADGRGDDDPCAAVLHADGRHDTVRRPRVHHADFPAARAAFPPRRRQSDVAERSAAGDSAVQSHGRAEHQPAAELCRDARDSAPLGADVPAGGGRDSPEI